MTVSETAFERALAAFRTVRAARGFDAGLRAAFAEVGLHSLTGAQMQSAFEAFDTTSNDGHGLRKAFRTMGIQVEAGTDG